MNTLRMYPHNLNELLGFSLGAIVAIIQPFFSFADLPAVFELNWFTRSALFVLTTFAGGFIGVLGKELAQRLLQKKTSKGSRK